MTVFEGTINNGDIQSILKSATVLVDVCRVAFEESKVTLRGTDPAGVGLVLIEISEDAFSGTTIEPGQACLDISEMADMVGTASDGEDVNLEVVDSELNINVLDLSFTLSQIHPDSLEQDHEKPDLELPAEVVLDSSAFQRGVGAADLVADHVELGISDENSSFYMEAKGDVNQVILQKKKHDLATLTAEPVSSTLPIEYLKDICSAIPDDKELSINLGDDYPAEISLNIINNATVTYFISPRLQPDT